MPRGKLALILAKMILCPNCTSTSESWCFSIRMSMNRYMFMENAATWKARRKSFSKMDKWKKFRVGPVAGKRPLSGRHLKNFIKVVEENAVDIVKK